MDECWLDLTGSVKLFGDGEKIAKEIKEKIKSELGLTVSIGVSFNKIFAKLGSDMKKPDAVTVISRKTFKDKIWKLPASSMLGVGRATQKVLSSYCINTIGDIDAWPVEFYTKNLGKHGEDIWRFANGLDTSEVKNIEYDLPMKSVGHGITTLEGLENSCEVWKVMLEMSQDIGHNLCKYQKWATGVAIDIKNTEMVTKQWQSCIPFATQSPTKIAEEAFRLFKNQYDWKYKIRSVTVRAINLSNKNIPLQVDIFTDVNRFGKKEVLDVAVDEIKNRF